MARRRSRGRKAKQYFWIANEETNDVRSSAGQVDTNGIELISALDTGVSGGLRAKVRVERVIIHGTTTRNLLNTVASLAWNVSLVAVDSIQNPVQLFDPQDTDPVRLQSDRIWQYGQLDVPANVWDVAAAALIPSGEARCFHMDFKPKKLINRSSELLNLRFGTATVDVVVKIKVSFKILISF